MLTRHTHRDLAIVVLTATTGLAFAQPSLTVLPSSEPGTPNGRGVMARGISGNGRVIVGSSAESTAGIERPYLWRRGSTGIWSRTELPMLGRTTTPSQASGRPISLSFDGDVAVGMVGPAVVYHAQNYGTAARWTGLLGDSPSVARLIEDPAFTTRSFAVGVSSDGARAFVYVNQDTYRALRLIDSSAGVSTTIAESNVSTMISSYLFTGNALSANGDRMVGVFADTARRWSDSGASETLFTMAPYGYGVPHVISADGNVTGGMSQSSPGIIEPPTSNFVPTLWYGTSRVLLPFLQSSPAFTTSGRVTALSRDGRIAGGVLNPRYPVAAGTFSNTQSQNIAALWIDQELVRLDTYLTSQGVLLQNVFPRWIAGISEDGTTITGWGTRTIAGNPNYEFVSFVATINVPAACDSLDFNNDTISPDSADLDDFLAVLAGGPKLCSTGPGQCNDLDFNNDGVVPDSTDLDAFLSRLSGGPCIR